MLGPVSWGTSKLKMSYKRKKDMILIKLTFIFMQKGTTFINTCCFSFDLEPTLILMNAMKMIPKKRRKLERVGKERDHLKPGKEPRKNASKGQ